jgi:hypothetical protein
MSLIDPNARAAMTPEKNIVIHGRSRRAMMEGEDVRYTEPGWLRRYRGRAIEQAADLDAMGSALGH